MSRGVSLLMPGVLFGAVFLSVLQGSPAFTRVGALTLNAGENILTSAVIDSSSSYAYFGTFTSPGLVVKVRLSDLTRIGNLTLNVGEDGLFSAVFNPVNGNAYFGTSDSPGRLHPGTEVLPSPATMSTEELLLEARRS